MTTQFHFQERRIKRKKDRKMIWIVKDMTSLPSLWVAPMGDRKCLGMDLINLICGLEYTVKHRDLIITSLFLGWHLSIHLSLMKTIEEFHEDFVIMANSIAVEFFLFDDVLKKTVYGP